MPKIPCSVCVLTHNSAATLERALESVKDFDEILICDADSTDSTRAIASRFGARVIVQDAEYKDKDGRLINFAGVRNQYLRAAKHDWIFALDSDELITDGLAQTIRDACTREPAAYWILRKYEFKGVLIERALNYPSKQMRFFHRNAVTEYIKPIHERIVVKDEAPIRTLDAYMIVPIIDDFEGGKRKWSAYIELERSRRSPISFRTWLKKSTREAAIMLLYMARLVRLHLFKRGTSFPIGVEVRIFWYQWNLIKMLFGKIHRL